MDMEQAAEKLRRRLALPPSIATILIWRSAQFSGLKVWIDRGYHGELPEIPTAFGGYDVKVEPRPEITAH